MAKLIATNQSYIAHEIPENAIVPETLSQFQSMPDKSLCEDYGLDSPEKVASFWYDTTCIGNVEIQLDKDGCPWAKFQDGWITPKGRTLVWALEPGLW